MGPYRKETRRILSFSSINKLGRGSFFLLRLKRPQFLINEGKIQASPPIRLGRRAAAFNEWAAPFEGDPSEQPIPLGAAGRLSSALPAGETAHGPS